jgi:hypothetical protein
LDVIREDGRGAGKEILLWVRFCRDCVEFLRWADWCETEKKMRIEFYDGVGRKRNRPHIFEDPWRLNGVRTDHLRFSACDIADSIMSIVHSMRISCLTPSSFHAREAHGMGRLDSDITFRSIAAEDRRPLQRASFLASYLSPAYTSVQMNRFRPSLSRVQCRRPPESAEMIMASALKFQRRIMAVVFLEAARQASGQGDNRVRR